MNPKLPLNEPQQRRLTIVLARLELALSHLQNDVLHPPESSRLTRYADPVDAALAGPIVSAIALAQRQVERMARALDLPGGANSIRRTHLAALQLLNVDLYASRPKGLRAYGKVAPATADYLEAEIADLEIALGEIVRLLKGSEEGQNHSRLEPGFET
jgi:hypothetical protein